MNRHSHRKTKQLKIRKSKFKWMRRTKKVRMTQITSTHRNLKKRYQHQRPPLRLWRRKNRKKVLQPKGLLQTPKSLKVEVFQVWTTRYCLWIETPRSSRTRSDRVRKGASIIIKEVSSLISFRSLKPPQTLEIYSEEHWGKGIAQLGFQKLQTNLKL